MAVQIQFRRGSAASWTAANPILADGEMGVESDTDQFKIGDGLTAWTSLGYGGLTGQGVPTGGATGQALLKASGSNYDTVWGQAGYAADDDQPVLGSQVFSS